MSTMRLSDHGKKLLEQWEGDIHHVYRDQAGLPTIGIGHLLTRSELSSNTIIINGVRVPLSGEITEQQALDLLAQDVRPTEMNVGRLLDSGPALSQNQFDALVIFSFNVGSAGFASSTVLKRVHAGQFDQVPAALLMWDKITDPKTKQHVASADLKVRRQREIKLWWGEI
ncbi:MAG TPA: lysozyme [Desulfuromonadaceae bacterium]